MKKQWPVVTLLPLAIVCGLVITLSLDLLAHGNQSQRQQAPYQIGGRLFDESTRERIPAGKVSIIYFVDGLERRHVQVDGEGSFLIRDLPYSAVYMIAKAPGYGRAVAFVIADPRFVQEVEFLLPRAASVEGLVLDRERFPVNRARVAVEYQDRLRDRLSEVPELVARAENEGLKLVTQEARRQSGGRPLTGVGRDSQEGGFLLSDIDPRRPFKLVCEHDVLGEIESEVMVLQPGENLKGYVLIYGGA
jgi:hypothetical protein